jgi:hypothetical protein
MATKGQRRWNMLYGKVPKGYIRLPFVAPVSIGERPCKLRTLKDMSASERAEMERLYSRPTPKPQATFCPRCGDPAELLGGDFACRGCNAVWRQGGPSKRWRRKA